MGLLMTDHCSQSHSSSRAKASLNAAAHHRKLRAARVWTTPDESFHSADTKPSHGLELISNIEVDTESRVGTQSLLMGIVIALRTRNVSRNRT